ncbi:MAG: Lipolytic enzyme [Solirubrobacterales bacterium]|nr:Lipolytic enzyme [Solirubrobacterales bacterium]
MPRFANRTVYVPETFDGEDAKRGLPLLVTLCGVGASLNSQRTLSPTPMCTAGLLKSMFLIVTVVVAAWAAAGRARVTTLARRSRRMPCLRVALACGSLALGACGGGGGARPAAPPSGGLRYGVIGDSYSNGEGVGIERSWPALLARRLHLHLVVNPAVSGWTSEQALAEELPAFERARPQVATLLIGVNDLVRGATLHELRGHFRELLAKMVRIVGGARRVVVVTVPDFSVKPAGASFGDAAAISRALRRLNRAVRAEAAAQHVAVADIFAVSRRPTDPSPDGLHPSARELEAWTDAIAPVARRQWGGLG